MTLAAFALSVLLGQAAPPPAAAPAAAPAPACGDTSEETVAALRRTASSMRDPAARKRAIEELACIFDADKLNLPASLDPLLRELIAVSPGELAPVFRLARLQERLELFDAAESTLLAARQQRPDEVAPYQELSQFFARRAATLSMLKGRDDRAGSSEDEGAPDKDGIYRLGGDIQPPEQLSSGSVPLPNDTIAAGIKGLVALEVVIDATGRVTDAKITQSVPGLDATALATVRTWRFSPATLNGRAVPVRMPVMVRVGG